MKAPKFLELKIANLENSPYNPPADQDEGHRQLRKQIKSLLARPDGPAMFRTVRRRSIALSNV